MAALVAAGSDNRPYLIRTAAGSEYAGKSTADAINHLRNKVKPDDGETYLGIAQIPASRLKAMGINPETALDICASLEIGHLLLADAYGKASRIEKSPWKTVSAAYSIFRDGKASIDSPFAKKATSYLLSGATTPPAGPDHPMRHAIIAEWSAGMASRQASRQNIPRLTPLAESSGIVAWARNHY